MRRTVIGLTGSFGSGCSFLGRNYLQPRGYHGVSLSTLLKEDYRKDNPGIDLDSVPRRDLQAFGNNLRTIHGSGFLAERVVDRIESDQEHQTWYVDSIKNPGEIEVLRRKGYDFYLFAVFADSGARWERVKKRYEGSLATFERDDRQDTGEEEDASGQRVSDCYVRADVIISNNDDCSTKGTDEERLLAMKVERYLSFIEGKEPFAPSDQEALMVVAYATGFRSSCLKRKVGAVIVNEHGTIISSGYNEVPSTERSCKRHYNGCYRDKLKKQYNDELMAAVGPKGQQATVMEIGQTRFRALDYCRALHAEENAVLALGWGLRSNLRGATLYVTTYPCNLCANKIAQTGVGRIVYLEPYPMKEAKEVLANARVDQVPFEGVTFNGYFRFKGGVDS